MSWPEKKEAKGGAWLDQKFQAFEEFGFNTCHSLFSAELLARTEVEKLEKLIERLGSTGLPIFRKSNEFGNKLYYTQCPKDIATAISQFLREGLGK